MTRNGPVQNNAPPSLFTLTEAAQAIASNLGWHDGARDTLKEQFMQAVRDGLLVVRHPHTDVPYRPDPVRNFYEQVTRADVNEWATRVGVSWRWGEQTQVPQSVPAHPAITRPPTLKRDAIAPVIELAQSQCRHPTDTAEVWAQMGVLADKETAPFLASTQEGLKYTTNGKTKYFSRDALNKRLHPEKRGAPVKRL